MAHPGSVDPARICTNKPPHNLFDSATTPTPFLFEMHNGTLCIPRKENRTQTHMHPHIKPPTPPQQSPDDIITFKRCYSTAKTDATYKRRVIIYQSLID